MIAEAVRKIDKPSFTDSQDQLAVIFEVESVNDYYKKFTSKGIEFVNAPQDRRDWGIRLAHFRDPAGNLIEINQGL
ncbi:VOC family protein [Paenibacillus mesophilus]|nr:VOC family protein [Paenibacillus mesophilus]